MAEKLVRDLVPFRILADTGSLPKMRLVSATERQERMRLLFEKLDEEVAEFKEAVAEAHDGYALDKSFLRENAHLFESMVEEAADVLEVLFSVVPEADVARLLREKRRSHGGFESFVVADL